MKYCTRYSSADVKSTCCGVLCCYDHPSLGRLDCWQTKLARERLGAQETRAQEYRRVVGFLVHVLYNFVLSVLQYYNIDTLA